MKILITIKNSLPMKLFKFIFAISLSIFSVTGFAEELVGDQTSVFPEINPMPSLNDDWRYSVDVAAWAPASTASVYSTSGTYIGSSHSSMEQNMQGGGGFAMLTGEAHTGNWGVLADLVYWKVSDGTTMTKYVTKKTSTYVGVSANTEQTMMTLAATYTVLSSPSLYVDTLFGSRYVLSTTAADVNTVYRVVSGVKTRTTISNTQVSNTDHLIDPIVGIKGRYRIDDTAWYLPFYADIGTGSGYQNFTWQTSAGVGYAFPWGDVNLVYRAMYFALGGSDGLTKYLNYGPQLSATFKF